jgi:beta-fructofuranosidase
VGDLDSKKMIFYAQKSGLLDSGAYYAPKTQIDARGNRILWGWIPERRPEAEFSKAGWAGCMSLPRILSLNDDSELEMRVAPEASALRAKSFSLPDISANSEMRGRALREMQIENCAAEVLLRFRNEKFAVALLDGARVFLQLAYDPSQSGKELKVNDFTTEIVQPKQPEIEIHIFIDASVAEIFVNNKVCLTVRNYQAAHNSLHLDVSDSDIGKVASLQVWQITPISANRLTT